MLRSRLIGVSLQQNVSRFLSSSAASTLPPHAQKSPKLYENDVQVESKLGWGVVRSANGNLPVYFDIRNYNSRKLTIIRKILGDPEKLRESILREFDVSVNDVAVRVGRVEVKGKRTREMREWLASKGF
ncbi:hypothetical protein GUITHDRAFT_100311 [Guillardia theta CCMP2712]|uniref:Large ribosomal subunit protein mL49 n=1 Tax=Guillardia theta (strain CCMP2712) TaxID=905079 RepID=L1JZN4_GUITC|nr:hypothetical protein GUITHDRAFT_100311 [Guillardia theta CCMP2712]EKX54061.1 hypothetical protein GUITHDRAFT_100311 [Guillardia theta CCMP2712]|eukprot:XP_005841041.1 hypothetical protein GUITHDRAFT_100311 [Guillardia theta CCMP2712]